MLVIMLALVAASFYLWKNLSGGESFNPTDIVINKKEKKEELVRAPISGRMVTKALAARRPIAVVVENHPDARPQSGLSQASMVIETLAEGGITRFLAIFQEEDVPEIGPVRSARPYFVDWAFGYKALFAHVGGNSNALSMIRSLKVYDLNQFSFGSFFWRDRTRYAPHNVYTTTDKLRAAAKTRNYPLEDPSTPAFSFKDDIKEEERPQNFSFRVGFDSRFAVTYSYLRADNFFYRSIAGVKHTDRKSGEQIKAKNVIVCFSDIRPSRSSIGEQMMDIRTTGSGKAVIFVDGTRSQGTWKREKNAIMRFYDATGSEVKLNGGTTWVDFVSTGTVVN